MANSALGLSLIALFAQSIGTNITWISEDSGTGCDFTTDEYARRKVSADECRSACTEFPSCTHYSWTTFEVGTCFLRKGNITKDEAVPNGSPRSICGIVNTTSVDSNYTGTVLDRMAPVLAVNSAKPSMKHSNSLKPTRDLVTLSPAMNSVKLNTKGKGTVIFPIKALPEEAGWFTITVGQLKLLFTSKHVALMGNGSGTFKEHVQRTPIVSLTHPKAPQSLIWLSIKSVEPAFIKIGTGYQMNANVIFSFNSTSQKENQLNPYIGQVEEVELQSGIELNEVPSVSPNPIYFDPLSFYILPENQTRDHLRVIDGSFYYPDISELPVVSQKLLQKVKLFTMTQMEIEAVEFSLENEGCVLNGILSSKGKGNLSGDPKSSYIRVPIHTAMGTAPGQELVMEIWPRGHYSPVHNHGNAAAIIKVISGSLTSQWFNPLYDDCSEAPESIFRNETFHAGQITWMTSKLYQTHKLTNMRLDKAAITVQAYGYEHGGEQSDVFKYVLPNDSRLHNFYPDTDICFFKLLKTALDERAKGHCLEYTSTPKQPWKLEATTRMSRESESTSIITNPSSPINQPSSATTQLQGGLALISSAHFDDLRVVLNAGSEIWKKSGTSKTDCARFCTGQCRLVQFDADSGLCTGYDGTENMKFVFQEGFSVFVTTSKNSSRLPGIMFAGEDIKYERETLGQAFRSSWTEEKCRDVCFVHPHCEIASFETTGSECRLQGSRITSLPIVDKTFVSYVFSWERQPRQPVQSTTPSSTKIPPVTRPITRSTTPVSPFSGSLASVAFKFDAGPPSKPPDMFDADRANSENSKHTEHIYLGGRDLA